jgi:hypothetical protein
MPFPLDLESLLAAGYVFARTETCPVCQEAVEVFTTPGKREIALNPMCELLRPAVRHYEMCNVTPKQEATNGSTGNDVQDAQGRDSNSGTDGTVSGPPGSSRQHNGEVVLPNRGLDAQGAGIKLYGVTDKNMIACGWLDGTLAIQFRYGLYHYTNVAEDVFVKISNPRQPYPGNIFTKLVKNHPELYPCTKME